MNIMLLYASWLFAATLVATNADIINTNGESGEVCGAHQCLKNLAFCNQGKCECHSGVGQGNFACYYQSEIYAEEKSDPVITTYAGERVAAHLPCRSLFTHLRTKYRDNNGKVRGSCEIKVYSFAFRIRGKFFVLGIDTYFKVNLSDLGQTKELNLRINGKAKGGVYTFDSDSFEPVEGGYLVWGGPTTVEVNNETIIGIDYDSDNNFAVINAGHCGVRVLFRPASVDPGQFQMMVPGLSVAVVKNDVKEWLTTNITLALPPFQVGPTVGEVSSDANLSPNEAFLARILLGDADQEFPEAPEQCSLLIGTAQMCDSKELRREALELCSSLLMRPKFVNCYADEINGHDTDSVLDLFRRCVESVCQKSTNECLEVEKNLKSHSCAKHVTPELKGFNCQF